MQYAYLYAFCQQLLGWHAYAQLMQMRYELVYDARLCEVPRDAGFGFGDAMPYYSHVTGTPYAVQSPYDMPDPGYYTELAASDLFEPQELSGHEDTFAPMLDPPQKPTICILESLYAFPGPLVYIIILLTRYFLATLAFPEVFCTICTLLSAENTIPAAHIERISSRTRSTGRWKDFTRSVLPSSRQLCRHPRLGA